MPLLDQHFPELTAAQRDKLRELATLFREWNAKINLVSRKDIDAFEEHHLLHALSAAKVLSFPPRTRVLDVGTGGGLPGLPLAILFPKTQFFLLDSVTKKANAVLDMAQRLGLKNVQVVNKRVETLESLFNYILGRAVTTLPEFIGWVGKNMRPGATEDLEHGVLYFKGTLYREELAGLGIEPLRVHDLHTALGGLEYYQDKFLVHIGADAVCQVASKMSAEAAAAEKEKLAKSNRYRRGPRAPR